MSVCAKCHSKTPVAPREQPRWCAKCYGTGPCAEASGGSLFTAESKTGWRGGRVQGAGVKSDNDTREGHVDEVWT